MNNEIERALNFDPIAEAEKVTGKGHWSGFDSADNSLALLMGITSNANKKDLLAQANDTYFGMSWSYFIDQLFSRGFKLGTAWRFTDDKYGEIHEEVAVIYYREDGILIFAESYSNATSVNSGKCWYELEFSDEANSTGDAFRRIIRTGGMHAEKKLNNQIDIREGLFHKLETAAECGKFIPVWEHNTFLWISDYVESRLISGYKSEDYGVEMHKLTSKHISACPEIVQKMVACRLK